MFFLKHLCVAQIQRRAQADRTESITRFPPNIYDSATYRMYRRIFVRRECGGTAICCSSLALPDGSVWLWCLLSFRFIILAISIYYFCHLFDTVKSSLNYITSYSFILIELCDSLFIIISILKTTDIYFQNIARF